jgi:hypothetical protein
VSGAEEEGGSGPRLPEGYLSPVPARLQHARRSSAPIRGIMEGASPPDATPPTDERLAELEDHVARLERWQRELVSALCDAEVALRQLADRAGNLASRAEPHTEEPWPAPAGGLARPEPEPGPHWHLSPLRRSAQAAVLLALAALLVGLILAASNPQRVHDTQAERPTSVEYEVETTPAAGGPETAGARQEAPPSAAIVSPSTTSPRAAVPVVTAAPSSEAASASADQASQTCQFVRGIAFLAGALGPEAVGECLENERTNPLNGNAEQLTTRGLLFWLRLENVAAFTDGATTWYACPDGIKKQPAGQPPPCESGLAPN